MKKVAYLILAHSDPTHLYRLLGALNYNSEAFCHLDSKADANAFDFVMRSGRAFFLKERRDVSWAGISMVDAIIDLMRAALTSGHDFSHLVILTGADYPLRSAKAIHDELTSNPLKEYLKYSDIRESPERYLKLITRRWFREPIIPVPWQWSRFVDRVLRKGLSLLGMHNRWDFRMVPYRGHTWCALTAACCKYIVDFHDNSHWYRAMNEYTFAPDEHYFHTIIGNSEFCKHTEGKMKCNGGLAQMATTHLIDPSLVKWFTIADWKVISSSERLFLRKVRTQDGMTLLDRIDRELH